MYPVLNRRSRDPSVYLEVHFTELAFLVKNKSTKK